MAKFSQLNLKNNILEAIADIGFVKMTPIQEKAIPVDLKNQNIIGHSQTGTGKTHAFLIPLFNKIEKGKNIQSVIIAPTRELARQVYDEAMIFNKKSKSELNIKLVIGGTDKGNALDKYRNNIPDVIVGTPGRIHDLFVVSNYFTLKDVKSLIIDEADMVFDLGFLDEMSNLSKSLGKKAQFQLYSATMPKALKVFVKKFVGTVKTIEIDKNHATSKNISHFLVNTKHKGRIDLIGQIIKRQKPYLAIVFVNNKKDVDKVVDKLKEYTKDVVGLHGGLAPRIRKNILSDLKNLKYNILVATDIAARGIDVKGVSHIYSIQMPFEKQYYIHRAGRTGRADMKGESYLFYDLGDKKDIDKLTSQNISFKEMVWKNDELIEKKVRVYKRGNSMKSDEEIETLTIITSTKAKIKRKGVKPGYRKKMKKQIAEVKRKKVRSAIKANIKQIRKQKAKEKQAKLKLINK